MLFEAGVASRLIFTVYAPRPLAWVNSEASGCTTAEVPTVRKILQAVEARLRLSAAGWIDSPNQTTPWRASQPQHGRRSGISGNGTVSSHHLPRSVRAGLPTLQLPDRA